MSPQEAVVDGVEAGPRLLRLHEHLRNDAPGCLACTQHHPRADQKCDSSAIRALADLAAPMRRTFLVPDTKAIQMLLRISRLDRVATIR